VEAPRYAGYALLAASHCRETHKDRASAGQIRASSAALRETLPLRLLLGLAAIAME